MNKTTPAQVTNWIASMLSTSRAKSEKECADMLGVTHNGLRKMKLNGTTYTTGLAMRWLLVSSSSHIHTSYDDGYVYRTSMELDGEWATTKIRLPL